MEMREFGAGDVDRHELLIGGRSVRQSGVMLAAGGGCGEALFRGDNVITACILAAKEDTAGDWDAAAVKRYHSTRPYKCVPLSLRPLPVPRGSAPVLRALV